MKELVIDLVKENLSLKEQIEALKHKFEKERSEYINCLKELKEENYYLRKKNKYPNS